jgi:peptide/nickel transport system substrate-binding protein
MQQVAMAELPFIPLGAAFATTAYSKSLSDRIVALPLFWNVRRA